MRIYLSGPMRHQPDNNRDAFERAEKIVSTFFGLEAEIINPINNPDHLTLEEYFAIDLQEVIRADVVAVLRGWENSEGARIEVELARTLNKEIIDAADPRKLVVLPVEIEAASLTRNGDRQRVYHHPKHDFTRTAMMWSGYLGTEVTAQDVALMIAMVKISRLRATPDHHDSIVDLIGYSICYSRLDEQI
jgi:Domain of unknown function (DUF6378)/Domain of unknown function (DUF4406)